MASNGASQTTPVEVNPANGYAATGLDVGATAWDGSIAFAALSGNNQLADQAIIISNDGRIWYWGNPGIIPGAGTQFQQASTPRSTSVGAPLGARIPDGLTVADIKSFQAWSSPSGGFYGVVVLSKAGEIYVSSPDVRQRGVGTVTVAELATWTKVKSSASGNPVLTGVEEVIFNDRNGFARTATGLYTWGVRGLLGDGSVENPLFFATPMTMPVGMVPFQLESSASSGVPSYYVLDGSGEVWVMGGNTEGQLGVGSNTNQLTWTKMHNPGSGTGTGTLQNVRFISANSSGNLASYNMASVILANGTLYSMGSNASFTIGGPGTGITTPTNGTPVANVNLPVVPNGTAGVPMFIAENGGHLTPVVRQDGSLCNVGHNQGGAYGNGTNNGLAYNSYAGGCISLGITTFVALTCDSDLDGIENQFDLDSDGDGCTDAIEGGGSFVTTNMVNSSIAGGNSGPGYIGSSSSPVIQNLGNTVGSTTSDMGVPTVAGTGQTLGDSQNGLVNACFTFCYKPAATGGTILTTQHGITALNRAGADNSNWPMVRKGAWTALEAKTKGFVINRIPTTAAVNAIANPVEGMMVYDEQADCLKINTTGTAAGWKCFTVQACPD